MLSLCLVDGRIFFEYEMKISFINIVSELKNMRDIKKTSNKENIINIQLFINMNTNNITNQN